MSTAFPSPRTARPAAEYLKFVVALVGAGVAVLATAVTDNVITPAEAITIALAVVAAPAVAQIENGPGGLLGAYGKSIVVAVTAALQALVLVVADVASFTDVALSDWLTVLVTAGTALGVVQLPNAEREPDLVA